MPITFYKEVLPGSFMASLILFLTLFSCHAFTQSENESLKLSEAISLTLASNPKLHQFSQKKIALQGKRQSSELSPALHVSIDIENFSGSGDYSGTDFAETSIALSSVIELGAKRKARVSVAKAKFDKVEFQRRAITLDILSELTGIFVRTLEIQELTTLATEARDLAENTLGIVKNRAQRGATPESEVKRAIAAVAFAQLHLDALQAQHQRAKISLASFWGETFPPWKTLEGDLYTFTEQADFSDLYQRALTSPAIKVFASETRLKNAELKLAQSQSSLDVAWQLGVKRFEETSDSAFVAGLSIPLFSGKRNQGALRSANAEKEEAELRGQSAAIQLHKQLYDAFSLREQFLKTTKVFQSTIIPELSSALTSTQEAYETGRYSYQEWISVQNELLEAKKILIESSALVLLNQAIIEQLVGESLNR